MSFFTKFIDRFRGITVYIPGSGTRSRPYNVQIENEEICSSIIDCNATHIARGQVLHVIQDENGRIKNIKRNSMYTKLFNRPNSMMTRQDFQYAMAWQLQLINTSIAWVKWDARMHPVEIWPITYLDFEIREIKGGGYAVQIHDFDGQRYTVRMEDLICLRRKYNGQGYAGQSNTPVTRSLEMVNSLDEGLKQALEISNKIHGIVKQKNSMLAPKSADKTQEDFISRMMKAGKTGGVVSLDATEEYTPVTVSAWAANAAQAKQITDRVYTYWRTPEEVVRNTATEQTMQNYYDSIVEPTWEEMGEAYTQALFTRKEQDFGNRIMVYSGAATGASWQTKLNILAQTKETGELSKNERRELLGYAPTEDGDEFFVSLNYVKQSDMTKYQTGEEPNGGKDGNKQGKTGQSAE